MVSFDASAAPLSIYKLLTTPKLLLLSLSHVVLDVQLGHLQWPLVALVAFQPPQPLVELLKMVTYCLCAGQCVDPLHPLYLLLHLGADLALLKPLSVLLHKHIDLLFEVVECMLISGLSLVLSVVQASIAPTCLFCAKGLEVISG